MRQCPENWQHYWTAPSCEVCPARILWGSFSLQPRGQTAHWEWERVPHTTLH